VGKRLPRQFIKFIGAAEMAGALGMVLPGLVVVLSPGVGSLLLSLTRVDPPLPLVS
jgi:hypothetical protein